MSMVALLSGIDVTRHRNLVMCEVELRRTSSNARVLTGLSRLVSSSSRATGDAVHGHLDAATKAFVSIAYSSGNTAAFSPALDILSGLPLSCLSSVNPWYSTQTREAATQVQYGTRILAKNGCDRWSAMRCRFVGVKLTCERDASTLYAEPQTASDLFQRAERLIVQIVDVVARPVLDGDGDGLERRHERAGRLLDIHAVLGLALDHAGVDLGGQGEGHLLEVLDLARVRQR